MKISDAGQNPVQILLCELTWMSAVAKQEEAANPVDVTLLSVAAALAVAPSFNHAVVQPRRGLSRKCPSGARRSAEELLMTLRLPLDRRNFSGYHT